MRRANIGPGVTVEKIPIELASGPIEPPPGKAVTDAKVRLINNLIVQDGERSRLIPRGEIVDLNLIPPHLRTDQLIEPVDEYKRDKVCLLHSMTFATPSFENGQSTVWREKTYPAFSLVDLATFPNRIVEGMTAGDDYLVDFDETWRKAKELEQAEEIFDMEEPNPDVGVARNPHLRYGDSL